MTTKEKIVNQSIKKVQKQLDKINYILEAKPLTELCNIRQETVELLENNKTIEQRTSTEFIAKIEALSIREKEQVKLAHKLKNSVKLIDQKIELESELSDLKTELYYIQQKTK